MARLIIENKSKILDSTAIKKVSDVIGHGRDKNGLYRKFTDFNIDNLQYTIIYKKGKSGDIFTIYYVGYEHTGTGE